MQRIDLRSDTVTLPSDAMRAAMASAPVGDDQYGEDPTVRALQEHSPLLRASHPMAALPYPTADRSVACQSPHPTQAVAKTPPV